MLRISARSLVSQAESGYSGNWSVSEETVKSMRNIGRFRTGDVFISRDARRSPKTVKLRRGMALEACGNLPEDRREERNTVLYSATAEVHPQKSSPVYKSGMKRSRIFVLKCPRCTLPNPIQINVCVRPYAAYLTMHIACY